MDRAKAHAFYSEIANQCLYIVLAYDQVTALHSADVQREADFVGRMEDWKARSAALDASNPGRQQRTALMDEHREIMASGRRDREPQDLQWIFLQSIVIAAANISKILWGSRQRSTAGGKREQEREPLRRQIGIDNSSPFYERHVRNRFEHFDEDLDDWYDKNKPVVTMVRGMSYGPSAIQPAKGIFGHYDHTVAVLTFGTKRVEIRPLVTEAKRILPLAKAQQS